MLIRVSCGTAVRLGLRSGRMLVPPTTAYLMTYHEGRCRNDCAFCPQARGSRASLEKLSRVTWPAFDLREVVNHLKLKNTRFVRICLQTIDYPGMVEDVTVILETLQKTGLPISLSTTPISTGTLREFRELGVDYVGVGLDVASERLYPAIKRSSYSWDDIWRFLDDAVRIFGEGKGIVHLIVGLGETDRELFETMRRVYSRVGNVSLFAFTPIKGTTLEKRKPPDLVRYRKIQALNFLLRIGELTEDPEFDELGRLRAGLDDMLSSGIGPEAFLTHGCPGCNRPYYNESPGSEPYNYPALNPVSLEHLGRH